MSWQFGFRKDFCPNLTTKGNCRQHLKHLNSEEKKCPYTQIPSPPENTKDKWEETLRYLESVSCNYNSQNRQKWLKELIERINKLLSNIRG
jgi:hypothetical protein